MLTIPRNGGSMTGGNDARANATGSAGGTAGNASDGTANTAANGAANTGDALNSDPLSSLVPRYKPDFHEDYARRLYEVCNPADPMDAPRNVALMGTFGSGKSSVLKGFLNRLTWGSKTAKTADEESDRYQNARTRFHSIAQFFEAKDVKLGHPVMPPCILVKSSEIMQSVDAKADHDQLKQDIQKEIVKQLIYSTSPSLVNGSHYRRLHSSRSGWRALGTVVAVFALAALVATVLSAIPSGIGIAGLWARAWDGQFRLNSPKFMIVVVMAVAAGIVSLAVPNLPWKPSSMSAKIETIELKADERGSIDIFDKYIDEIVFLIERAKVRFVIFEDLDRVNQIDIYYELRELNTLINDSRHAQGKPPVTFIYVMGDEALDPNRYEAGKVFGSEWGSKWVERQPGAVTAETKAKFFDVSVYLRPFFSPAYDVASVLGDADLANGENPNATDSKQFAYNPSNADLLALIRSELPDQRTLLDVKNLYAMTVERMRHINFADITFDPDECLAVCAMRIAYPYLTVQIIRRDIDFTELIHDRDHASDAPMPRMVCEFIRLGLFDDNYLAYLVDWESRISPATFALLQEAAGWNPYCEPKERQNTWEKPLASSTVNDLAEALAHHVGLDLIERRCPYVLFNRNVLDAVYGSNSPLSPTDSKRCDDLIKRLCEKHFVTEEEAKPDSALYGNVKELLATPNISDEVRQWFDDLFRNRSSSAIRDDYDATFSGSQAPGQSAEPSSAATSDDHADDDAATDEADDDNAATNANDDADDDTARYSSAGDADADETDLSNRSSGVPRAPALPPSADSNESVQ